MSQNRRSGYGLGSPQVGLAPVPFKSQGRQFTGNTLNYAYNIGQLVFQEVTDQWIVYRGNGLWDVLGGTGSALLTLTGDDGVVVQPDTSGTINVFGQPVITGTNAKAVYFKNTSANTLTAQIQVGGSASSSNISNAGLIAPNSAMFTTDSNGFLNAIGNIQSSSGSTVNLKIENTSNTSSSDAALVLQTAGISSGDPYLQMNIAGNDASYALGIANTGGSNDLKLQVGTSPVTPETGTNAWSINPSTGVQTFGPNPICNLITINDLPVVGTDGANKTYVDSVAQGFTVLNPTAAATTTNLNATYNNGSSGVGATLTNAGTQAAFSVDGYNANLNDRILVKNQTTAADNGIYSVTTVGTVSTNWVLTRTTDYDTVAQIKPGTFVIVQNGTTQANTAWVQYQTVSTIGTNPINWAEFGISIDFPITISQGGTNATSMANSNGINYFDGTRIVTASSLTNGELLIGNSGNPPTATTLTAGSGVTITNSPGSITISSSGSSGQIVNFSYTQTAALTSGSTTFPTAIAGPVANTVVNTDGSQIFTLTVTPQNASNILRLQANIYGDAAKSGGGAGGSLGLALFQDSTVDALFATANISDNFGNTNQQVLVTMDYMMVAGTTSSTTFNIRVGAIDSNIWQLNSLIGTNSLPGNQIYQNTYSTFTITEISQ